MLRPLATLLVLAVLPALAAARTPPPPLGAICGTSATPPAWEHVVWIWFENHGYDAVVGSGAAAFMDRALIPRCGLATNYHGLAHPSVPNYIAATSGLPLGALGPLRDDCNATGPCHTRATSIFEQAPSWGAYEESMRRPCTHWFTGAYAAGHNPAVYYDGLPGCAAHDVSLKALWPALDADTLPAFVFVTPNMCHDMHGCSVQTGDAWLSHFLRRFTASPVYQRGTTAIFVTFDESEKDSADNHVATIVVSPSTAPHTRSGKRFDHYSLLRTTEEMLGLPLLRQAAHAPSMRAAFGL